MGDRLPNETDRAWQAYQDFRDMGAGRTVRELGRRYKEQKGNKSTPPTSSYQTLKNWAFENNWNERVRAWDAEQQRRDIESQKEARRRQWEADVEQYRKRNQEIGGIAFVSAVNLLQEANYTMSYESQKRAGKSKLHEPSLTKDQALKAFSAVKTLVELARDTNGTALQINELLEEYGLDVR